MDQNKLYNALLKRQSEQQNRTKPDAKPDEEATDTRPYAERVQEPSLLEKHEDLYPSVYDSAASLDLINNPKPWSLRQMQARKIIYPSMREKGILNAYREIRIKLRNMSDDQNFTTMVTTLSKRQKKKKENALLPAFNLAASFAFDSHSSALLVDCNPYYQDAQELVSMPIYQGITDYLSEKRMPVTDIIYPSGVDRLTVVPAGNTDVSVTELFSSPRMKELMEELKGRYPDRYIVINAPPFRLSTEARILVKYVDHAIMTVPFGEITPDDILESIDILDTDKFAGVVYQD